LTLDILRVSALEYIRKVEDGEFTAEEFAAETLRRIRDAEPRIHAYLHVEDESRVLEQARAVDRGLRSGRPPQPGGAGRCMGMPMSIKDNICVRGARTTCGSRMLEEYVSPYDSTAVSRLRSEDALIIAKANMDEFAMGLTTEFSAFGPSRNPWNEEYVPGGSSGGSAAATAALECVASLGSDTGGSVRNPASFCSVVGYKPTYGLISRYGLVSYANSIEQIGPIARTVSDVAFLLEIIAGYDPHDGTTIRPVPGAAGGPDGDSPHGDIVKSAAGDCPESAAAPPSASRCRPRRAPASGTVVDTVALNVVPRVAQGIRIAIKPTHMACAEADCRDGEHAGSSSEVDHPAALGDLRAQPLHE